MTKIEKIKLSLAILGILTLILMNVFTLSAVAMTICRIILGAGWIGLMWLLLSRKK